MRHWLTLTIVLFAPSAGRAQTDQEHGREILQGVAAMHLMCDFGIEALEPQHDRALDLAIQLAPANETAGPGNDEWSLRYSMLRLERLGRELVAGEPMPDEVAKILRATSAKLQAGATTGSEYRDAYRKLIEAMAERLIAGKRLTEVEWSGGFRSGDQLNWEAVEGLTFDVARLALAYPAADSQNQHAMRILLGLRGKSDPPAVEMTLQALHGEAPIERYDAALTAGRLRPPLPRLVSALTDRLDDADPRVVRAAIRSLLALNAKSSAPAMLDRLRQALDDKDTAALEKKLRFEFQEYGILDSHIGFRYDIPSELLFALGRFRYQPALPLLWEVVQGKGAETLHFRGELGHGGVAFEAIVSIDPDTATANARRVLEIKATDDALGAAANELGKSGQLDDIPAIAAVMARFDARSRREPRFHYRAGLAMSRVVFAAERLLYFADPAAPGFAATQEVLLTQLRACATGRFGTPIMAALEYLDPKQFETTALRVAADVTAEPNARRVAIEILGRSKQTGHIEDLLGLFEDDGNATNGPVGLHAAWATLQLLSRADRADPQVALLVDRIAYRLLHLELADPASAFLPLLIRVDSYRGVRRCSVLALDERLDTSSRLIALEYIVRYAEPNRALAPPLVSLLDVQLEDARATQRLRSAAANALARLLGLDPQAAQGDDLADRVRNALQADHDK